MRVYYKGRTVSVTIEPQDDIGDVALTVLSIQSGNPLHPAILVVGPGEKMETLRETMNG